MKCPYCDAEMSIGSAIDTGRSDKIGLTVAQIPRIDHKHLKLIACLKCPKCGYSDDLPLKE